MNWQRQNQSGESQDNTALPFGSSASPILPINICFCLHKRVCHTRIGLLLANSALQLLKKLKIVVGKKHDNDLLILELKTYAWKER